MMVMVIVMDIRAAQKQSFVCLWGALPHMPTPEKGDSGTPTEVVVIGCVRLPRTPGPAPGRVGGTSNAE